MAQMLAVTVAGEYWEVSKFWRKTAVKVGEVWLWKFGMIATQ
jgi:hypothetical protein